MTASVFVAEQAAGATITGIIEHLWTRIRQARSQAEQRGADPAIAMTVQIAQINRTPGGETTVTGLRVEGPAEDAISAVEAILRQTFNGTAD